MADFNLGVAGYEGANYQTHEAQGSPPGAIVVDNADADSRHRHLAALDRGPGIRRRELSGARSQRPRAHGHRRRQHRGHGGGHLGGIHRGYGLLRHQLPDPSAGTGADSFTWTPTIPVSGSYQVYARWTAHPNRSTHATYTVNHAAGATAVTVNQEANGGTWQLLGTFTLDAGTGQQRGADRPG